MSRRKEKGNKIPKNNMDDHSQKELHEIVRIEVQREIKQTSIFCGPIPPPEILKQYQSILPGSADRILKMAENQSKHRQDIEKTIIKGDSKRSFLGTISGFLIGIIGLFGGFWLISKGFSGEGIAAFLTPLATLIGVFIIGSNKRKKERLEKQKEMKKIT